MTKIISPPLGMAPVPSSRFAHNGDIPSPTALRRVAHLYNQVSSNRRKMIFLKSYDSQSTPSPSTTTVRNIRFMFRTGENVHSIAVMAGLAPSTTVSGTNKASIQMSLFEAPSTTLTAAKLYYPKIDATGLYTPGQVAWVWGELVTGLQPNTNYYGYVDQQHYCRVHSIMIYETAGDVLDSSVDGVCDPLNWEQGKPIYDDAVQDIAETGTLLWQHNAAHLLSWTHNTGATIPSVTSATYVNLLEMATSAVTAASPGFRINTQYHDSQKGDVPVELAIYCSRTGGSGTLSIKLVDAAGTVVEETAVPHIGGGGMTTVARR